MHSSLSPHWTSRPPKPALAESSMLEKTAHGDSAGPAAGTVSDSGAGSEANCSRYCRSQALEGPSSRSIERLGPVTKALHSGTSCASLASSQSAVLSETRSEKG